MSWSDWGHQYGAPLQQLCTLLSSLTILLGLLWFSDPYPFFVQLKFHLSAAFSNCKEKSDYCSLLWAPVALTVYRAQAAQSMQHLPSESGLRHLGIYAAHRILEPSLWQSITSAILYWSLRLPRIQHGRKLYKGINKIGEHWGPSQIFWYHKIIFWGH